MQLNDNLLLKNDIQILKNNIEEFFAYHGEIRSDSYKELKNKCKTLSIEFELLDVLISQVKEIEKVKNTETKHLINWVKYLSQSFEQDAAFCENKKDKSKSLDAAQILTAKSLGELDEIFTYIKNKSVISSSTKPIKRVTLKKSLLSFSFITLMIIITLYLINTEKDIVNEAPNSLLNNKEPIHASSNISSDVIPNLKESVENKINVKPLLSTLTIHVSPIDAEIIIVSSSLVYKSGMLLAYGQYEVQLSAVGFEPLNKSILLNQKQQQFSFTLRKKLPKAIQQLEQSLIDVPAGIFTFPLQKNNKKKQQHYLEAFQLMNSEVTFSMWDVCYQQKYCQNSPNDYGWGRNQHPVIGVSFDEINQQFLPWLKKITGHSYTLPTETQWEYAANLSGSYPYAWGSSIGDNNANCANCGSQWDNKETAPIKSFASNKQGFYDLNGNVWELTQDCWSKHLTKPQTDGSAWLVDDCNSFVIKGGSYMVKAEGIALSTRNWVGSGTRGKSIGFRLVKTLEEH